MPEEQSSAETTQPLRDQDQSERAMKGKCLNSVYLNVYNLTNANRVLQKLGIGAFHTAIEVFDSEFAFGGHAYSITGIFSTKPKCPPGLVTFNRSIYLGRTELSKLNVLEMVSALGKSWLGNSYHLLDRNCNHFSQILAFILTGRNTPDWINRITKLGSAFRWAIPNRLLSHPQTPSVDDATRI
ncbi:hypothetical protein PCE1_003641 [Barthelona sp. PCE]